MRWPRWGWNYIVGLAAVDVGGDTKATSFSHVANIAGKNAGLNGMHDILLVTFITSQRFFGMTKIKKVGALHKHVL